MATQIVDTDGHIFEKDQILFEYLDPPYRGRQDMLALPFFPSLDGFHRMARRVADGKSYVVGADDPKSWLDILDREGLDRTVIYPTMGLAIGFVQDPEWAVVLCRAYNNMLADRYTRFNRRLQGAALLPALRRGQGQLEGVNPPGLPQAHGSPS